MTRVAGPASHCHETIFDREYGELPEQISPGCRGLLYGKRIRWDRGLGAVVTEKDRRGDATTLGYDGFGRPIEVHEPDPITSIAGTEPTLRIVYFTAPGGPVQRTRVEARMAPGTWREAWGYSDGLGTPLLSLEQADPAAGDGGRWRVSGLPARGRSGWYVRCTTRGSMPAIRRRIR